MIQYGEFKDRSKNKFSRHLQILIAKRVLKFATKTANLNPESTSILEIGCAMGNGFRAAQQLNFRTYDGVEPTPALANYFREHFKKEVVEAKLPNLDSIPNCTFDLCFSINVLEHSLNHIDAAMWLEEMLRVVDYGGIILIVTPNVKDYGVYFWDCDWTHSFPTTPNRLQQLCEGVGLQVLSSKSLIFGSSSKALAAIAYVSRRIFPTRIIDNICSRYGKNSLGSNFAMLFFWGMCCVVAQKPSVESSFINGRSL